MVCDGQFERRCSGELKRIEEPCRMMCMHFPNRFTFSICCFLYEMLVFAICCAESVYRSTPLDGFFFVHFDSELLCTLCNSAFEQYDPRSCTKIVVWFRCVLLRFLLNMKFDANDSQMFTQISGLQFHCGSISFSVSISIWTKWQIHQQRCADHKNTKKKREKQDDHYRTKTDNRKFNFSFRSFCETVNRKKTVESLFVFIKIRRIHYESMLCAYTAPRV